MRDRGRLALIACAALAGLCGAAGCATPLGSEDIDFAARDFTPAEDLAVPDDLAAADLAAGGADLSGADLAARPDLATSPDLSPAGCADAGADEELTLAVVGQGGALHTARFSPGGGWTPLTSAGGATLKEVAALYAGAPRRAVIVAQANDDKLVGAVADLCTGAVPAPAQVFANALTSRRPALAAGTQAEMVFKGSISGDQRLYHSAWDGAAWSFASQQASFLTNLAPSAAPVGSVVRAIFTGTDGKVYEGVIGGAAAQASSATSAHSPAAVSTGGTAYLVFTGQDTNLYWTRRSGSGWDAPLALCTGLSPCIIDSNHGPVLALDATGKPIAAWRGKNDRVYTSTLTGTQWSAPVEAGAGESIDHLPALAPGLDAAAAEIVYVRASDDVLRHARLTAGTWSAATTVAGSPATATPALAAR
jgi:hypothetical protein